MANPKCCNKTMQKQEIHYGQNWLCLECGRELKTPANGMTQKDIDGYYAARSKFAAILIQGFGSTRREVHKKKEGKK